MRCQFCDAELAGEPKFCQNCGKPTDIGLRDSVKNQINVAQTAGTLESGSTMIGVAEKMIVQVGDEKKLDLNDAMRLYGESLVNYHKGDYREAREAVAQVIEILSKFTGQYNPELTQAYKLLGRINRQIGNRAAAQNAFEQADKIEKGEF